ncbi:MAG: gamma-glutamyltransferase [Parvibaculum sp.]|uniref:gamma-glutamyltransferase n=1 Tax=Parvibaculum sp. TaxID=2024848 RepID=UPI0025D488F1|nr:gamma-glutamyltransferase [Parvibaculum sp.]MCE9650980.1 gamma-glutamyltransferase [Parvibaculum sp.]
MPLKRFLPVVAATLLVAAVALWLAFGEGSHKPYMVAAANPYASDAGAEILAKGGSAVDAAIAVQAVLTLVEPESSGLAGGAFMMHWAPREKKLDAYDGRETAPAGATPDMFMSGDKTPLGIIPAILSGRSVGTPGAVAMLALAHKEHGKLSWASLFEPVIELSERGFVVSPKLAAAVARDPALADMPVVQDYFFTKDSTGKRIPVAAGTVLKNPRLAETMKTIAAQGPDGFYKGAVAQAIVDQVNHAPTRPGTLSMADLAGYEAKHRDPLCRPYREYRVCAMPPPTSGGIATLQILGILENFDMGQIAPMSLVAVHFIAEAEKLAYADRGKFLGDPDFVPVPVDALLDATYLRKRAALIDPSLSMKVAKPGDLGDKRADAQGVNVSVAYPSTSHFAIIDAQGNVVSMTTSVEAPFGSHLMAAGMILNNQLTDFSFLPEEDGKPVANAVAPGKRPMSAMDPVIVFGKDGNFFAAVGSPGGSRIIGYVTQTLVALLDWHMDMQSAVALPRFLDRNGPLEIEEGTSLEKLVPGLKQLGHEVKLQSMNSGLHGIRITARRLDGGADPRREGKVVTGTQ